MSAGQAYKFAVSVHIVLCSNLPTKGNFDNIIQPPLWIGTFVISGSELERIARKLVADSGKGRIAPRAFREAAPTIAEQIVRDADSPLLQLWGKSRNFDEFARDVIVHPKLLTVIGALANVKIRDGRAYHAGLIHTYGYLFSWLPTPYGFKRERWLNHAIEDGLGIPRRTIVAEPRAGTLLQNLSWCLAHIALNDCPAWKRIRTTPNDVPAALRDLSFDGLKTRRITERVNLTDAGGRRKIELCTDLVALHAKPNRQADLTLIVYSAKDAQQGGRKLVSAFTTETANIRALCHSQAMGRNKPIRPRYNCYIEGFPSEPILGIRSLAPQRRLS